MATRSDIHREDGQLGIDAWTLLLVIALLVLLVLALTGRL